MVVETSRSIARVARELGVNETTLGYRVKAYRERHAGDEPELGNRRVRLLELKRRNRELEMENEAEPAVSSVSQSYRTVILQLTTTGSDYGKRPSLQ